MTDEGPPITACRPLRIVHVIYSGLGGHSAVLFSLLEAGFLAGAEHHVVLAGIEKPPRDYTDRLDWLGVGWSHIGKKEGRAHLDFYRRLRTALFAPGTDVVYLHGVAAIPAVAMMIGRRRRGPLVVLRETEPTQVKTLRVWAMLALAHRCTDAVVHLTPEAAADAHARLRFLQRPGRTHVIANGLDTSFFSPPPQPRPSDCIISIGMQSRLQPTKDHLTLIEAFSALRAAHPSRNLRLEIAGDGPTRQAIEAYVAALGLSDAVTLHGMLGREGVRDFLRGLDFYVHSSFGETQSNAIMQAMSTGLPVVASDVAGVSNMIRPGLGLLHRSGDAEHLAQQLGRLINEPTLARDLGQAARSQALAVYGAGASARAWEALITRLREVGSTKTILHMIPYDTVAGVETAARTVPTHWPGKRFLRAYLVRKNPVEVFANDWHGPAVSENSLRAQFQLFRFAWSTRPDLLVGSLWRVAPVMIALQWLRPQLKTVLFLHLARDVHGLDWLLNRLAMWRAEEIWADSRATFEARVPARWKAKGRVLSFMTAPPNLVTRDHRPPAPQFVFWGRLQPQKDLLRALDVFAAVHRRRPDARFVIFGPDRGEGPRLRARIAELGLEKAVDLAGPVDHDELFARARDASFYLQTSHEEGMAMSVIEAMALRLVPVVTPVGEIANYARHGKNALLVTGDAEAAAAQVLMLLDDPARFQAIARAASATWADQALYRDDFVAACNRLLDGDA